MEYVMFYFATDHSNADYILKELRKELDEDKLYLVTEEISKTSHRDVSGQHFHIITELTDKQYTNYSKRVIMKLGLRGKADLGLAKQYGKVKIKDLDRALSYILKDGGKHYTNMTDDQIQEFYNKSFKKDETRDIRRMIIKSLIELYDTPCRWEPLLHERSISGCYSSHQSAYEMWQQKVVELLILEKAPVVSKTQIENIIKQFVQESVTLPITQKIHTLIDINNCRNPYKYI